jgi:hypothetical protein
MSDKYVDDYSGNKLFTANVSPNYKTYVTLNLARIPLVFSCPYN